MDALESTSVSEIAPLLAGLVTAGVVSAVVCRVPRAGFYPLGAIVGSAAGCVLITLLAGAAGAWVLRKAVSGASAERGVILHSACMAAWFAPLSLLLQQRSLFGIAVSAALAANTTLLLCVWRNTSADVPDAHAEPALLAQQVFLTPDGRPLVHDLLPAFSVVVCAEAAGIAQMAQHFVLAAGLAGASAAILARSFAARVLPGESRSRLKEILRSRPFPALVLAMLTAILSLLPFLQMGNGYGLRGSKGASQTAAVAPQGPQGSQRGDSDTGRRPLESSAGDWGGGYSGIVLWPKHEELTRLVAPPVATASSLPFGSRATAVEIPFNGVYWVFKLPDLRPPLKSHEAHGSPEEFNIRSTDSRPLRLEAHQNLGTLIDLKCCRALQIAIRNADRYPGTVSLELILRNTTQRGKPSLSLGSTAVVSSRPWTLYGDRPPVHEVLNFNIPAEATLHQFDELTVVFQVSFNRSDYGAKIGIEKFTLLPRGLP